MRIYLFFLLLLLNQNTPLNQEFSNDELFRKGNALYKEGKYEDAIEQYRKIIDGGILNGNLFYNLGNAYFRKGKIGYAILYYKKALKFLPRDRELNENLRFVRSYTQDRIEEEKPPFLIFILYVLLKYISLKELAVFVSIIFSITIICSMFFILKKSFVLIKNLTISLVVILLFSGFLLFSKLRTVDPKMGIVLVDVVDVKSAPSDDATLEFIIHEGTELFILESTKEWVKIKLKDGKTGWLTANAFGQI